ncbi:MAG: 4-(cytidine 5'-diphospho)-2-C-methyl-D-erythritol kinase [Planctomycetota bacterium]|nr:4-(cytidine 5'-diphospho)-2-C-methyl-D-erythritol kinase [Planctomycetota bacterium]
MLFRCLGPNLVVHTPAKLNLFLEVFGKRQDGFHELETLMVSISLYDSLTFSASDTGRVELACSTVSGSTASDPAAHDLPLDDRNLIVRAAELLRNTTGTAKGVQIRLTKRIPIAGGLAGGSSDAAATLMGLNGFWKLGLSASELQELGSQLGSDIAFFLNSTPAAICRGRGELIESLAIPMNLHFVVAKPSSGLSTANVFKHCRPADQPRSIGPLVQALQHGELRKVGDCLHNRLQQPAESLSIDVKSLNSKFSELPLAGHLMSGSGTCCFGVCGDARIARRIARQLRARQVPSVFAAQPRL